MDDILLAGSHADTLEKMFGETKEFFLLEVCRKNTSKKNTEKRFYLTTPIPILVINMTLTASP